MEVVEDYEAVGGVLDLTKVDDFGGEGSLGA
jgi:hypothetical protein